MSAGKMGWAKDFQTRFLFYRELIGKGCSCDILIQFLSNACLKQVTHFDRINKWEKLNREMKCALR